MNQNRANVADGKQDQNAAARTQDTDKRVREESGKGIKGGNGQLQAGGYREQNAGSASAQNVGSVKQAQDVDSAKLPAGPDSDGDDSSTLEITAERTLPQGEGSAVLVAGPNSSGHDGHDEHNPEQSAGSKKQDQSSGSHKQMPSKGANKPGNNTGPTKYSAGAGGKGKDSGKRVGK
jgi:hypothetical protein